jgi:uncharacterized protein YegJ (DUF2314 family)
MPHAIGCITVTEPIVLAVPERLSATYVVPTARPPADARALAKSLVDDGRDGPVRAMVARLFDSALLRIEVRAAEPGALPPTRALASFGATRNDLARIEAATHVVIVSATYRPGWPPMHEWGARLVALVLARELDAPLVDALVPMVLPPDKATRSLESTAVVDWILVVNSHDSEGMWFTTKGLGRWGLPELQALNVPPQLTSPWTSVINGLAGALLSRWFDALGDGDPQPFVEMPSTLTLDRRAVGHAYNRDEDAGPAVEVALTFDPPVDPTHDAFLTIIPPVHWAGSSGEFFADVCQRLWGAAPSDVRTSYDEDAMDEAIATARASMGEARRRFLDQPPTQGSHLIVKHRLTGAGGNEYVWAFVTDWSKEDTIRGHSANDAAFDPSVRVGRPVVIDTADVIDWAIWLDGQGIVEGGWTDRIL